MRTLWLGALVALAACDIEDGGGDEVFCDCTCTCEDGTDEMASKFCPADQEDECCGEACDLACEELGAGIAEEADGTCEVSE